MMAYTFNPIERQKQAVLYEFKASLSTIASSEMVKTTNRPCLKKEKKKLPSYENKSNSFIVSQPSTLVSCDDLAFRHRSLPTTPVATY